MAKGRVNENRVISDAMDVLKREVGNVSVGAVDWKEGNIIIIVNIYIALHVFEILRKHWLGRIWNALHDTQGRVLVFFWCWSRVTSSSGQGSSSMACLACEWVSLIAAGPEECRKKWPWLWWVERSLGDCGEVWLCHAFSCALMKVPFKAPWSDHILPLPHH